MNTIERIHEEIQKVRSVALGQEAAYVARSRLGRVILSCLCFVAKEVGVENPTFPRMFRPPHNATPQLIEITHRCNRILELTKTLSQPSEPLEERWKETWKLLLQQLELLDTSFRKYNTCQ